MRVLHTEKHGCSPEICLVKKIEILNNLKLKKWILKQSQRKWIR